MESSGNYFCSKVTLKKKNKLNIFCCGGIGIIRVCPQKKNCVLHTNQEAEDETLLRAAIMSTVRWILMSLSMTASATSHHLALAGDNARYLDASTPSFTSVDAKSPQAGKKALRISTSKPLPHPACSTVIKNIKHWIDSPVVRTGQEECPVTSQERELFLDHISCHS